MVQPQYGNGVTSVSARSLAMFPEGMPAALEVRSKLAMAATLTAVSDRDLALMRAKLELAKRQ